MTYFKVKPANSLYFNYPTLKDPINTENIKRMFDVLEKLLTKTDTRYDSLSVSEFTKQIKMLFEYNDPKNGCKIFLDNYMLYYESMLMLFRKVNHNEALRILAYQQIELKPILSKCKLVRFKEFSVFILKAFYELTEYFRLNKKEQNSLTNKKYNNKESCLDFLARFYREVLCYLASVETLDPKTCCKPVMDLIIALLKVGHNTSCLKLVDILLSKKNFFLLKQYAEETLSTFNLLVDLLYDSVPKEEQIDKDARNEVQGHREYMGVLKECFESFEERLSVFDQSVQLIQNSLIDRLMLEPIASDINSDAFFETIHVINQKLAQFELYTSDLGFLKKSFEKATSLELLESIQTVSFNQRSDFFMTFFRKVNNSLKTRNDIQVLLQPSLIKWIKSLKEMDNFVNEFQKHIPTNNYLILMNLSFALISSTSTKSELVEELIDLWLGLVTKDSLESSSTKNEFRKQDNSEEESDDDNIQFKEFFDVICLACKNYTHICAEKAPVLWKLYLAEPSYKLRDALTIIYPQSHTSFFKLSSDSYSKFLLNTEENDEKRINEEYSLLLVVVQNTPSFLLREYNKTSTNFIELMRKYGSNTQNLSIIIGLLYKFIEAVKLNPKILSPAEIQVLFRTRESLFWILFQPAAANQKRNLLANVPFPLDARIRVVCEIFEYLASCQMTHELRDNVKLLITDLIECYDDIKTKECIWIFFSLKQIGEMNQNFYLETLKEFKELLKNIKENSTTPSEVKENITGLIDFVEGRNITDLYENASNLLEIGEKMARKEKLIDEMQENLKKQESNLNNLNENLSNIDEKMNEISGKVDEQGQKLETIDEKTLSNFPPWCKDIAKVLANPKSPYNWILVAKRLNFTENDITGWLSQADPCLSMFQEWFLVNKTSDAIAGLLKVFKELNNTECVNIIETNMKSIKENDEISKHLNDGQEIDEKLVKKPPQIFISYEWTSKEKAELLVRYLDEKINENITNDLEKVDVWFDNGQMGGGTARANRIDVGLRSCCVLLCLVSQETSKDQNCLNQVNLAVQLNKAIIPLLMDSKVKWPPAGSLGPIFSEYLFIRFFQRPAEVTNDERYWPVDKFNELVMQLRQIIPPPIIRNPTSGTPSSTSKAPEVFISYQWGKQKEIIRLYNKLTSMGLTVWLDIYQMGGGDSLYDKIDQGIRNCYVVISCITLKYSLSANCKKEIALSDSISKPIVPILLEKNLKYPPPGPMAPTLAVLKYIDFTQEDDDKLWDGDPFNELMESIKPLLPQTTANHVISTACVIS